MSGILIDSVAQLGNNFIKLPGVYGHNRMEINPAMLIQGDIQGVEGIVRMMNDFAGVNGSLEKDIWLSNQIITRKRSCT